MEITWYGLSCFRITERGMATVVTDPFDHGAVGYEPLKLKAEIVTASHESLLSPLGSVLGTLRILSRSKALHRSRSSPRVKIQCARRM